MREITKKLLQIAPIRMVYGVILTLVKKAPRIAFYCLAFLAIFWVGQQLYYRFAPAESFLNYYYAKVDDTPIGTEPLATLCRRVSIGGIKIEAVRTFIRYEDAEGKLVTAGEYEFTAGVEQLENDTGCMNVRLRNQPQIKGLYSAHTEYVFYINGYRKSGSYDTNKYNMTETKTSLEEQIKKLQDQIDILRQQLMNAGGDSTTSGSAPSTASPSTNNGQEESAAADRTPSPQTPETPATPAKPSETCIINVLGLKVGCTTTRVN